MEEYMSVANVYAKKYLISQSYDTNKEINDLLKLEMKIIENKNSVQSSINDYFK